jgi:hypothetical protein
MAVDRTRYDPGPLEMRPEVEDGHVGRRGALFEEPGERLGHLQDR